ncbi:Formate dehydrogenase-O subunit gamma [Phaeobacter sp. CECT 5382]|uniref:formate dehydrogenase subunit gamma n=1 Tax=Rhodobacterales TaxID=204455 RepID=UPI0006DB02C1|nr:formate dehydrogenase subunit gamma [Phaeobacter sp. CECT 5382]CUH87890.1 Formate dehydrogenase-O subunit gamma [Phaeobacter sp. CECT 5382]
MLRLAFVFFMQLMLCLAVTPDGVIAQEVAVDRSATGGAQTLDDILARQRGQALDESFRSDNIGDPNAAAAMTEQLGTLGGASDPELWRQLRYGSAEVKVSSGGEVATVLVQDGGMRWLQFRAGPLRHYGGWLLLGTIGALLLFFLLRGKIMIDGEKTGRTVTRFKAVERFGHWLLAGSFIVLGVTGILSLFGRVFIAPYLGKMPNAVLLDVGKWLHNVVAWGFMVGLVMIFVMWVLHNIPNRTDLVWLRQFGGIIGSAHPPAKKFNAGQKLIFWSVVLFGFSISVSGLSLLFPYELPLFAKTFAALNAIGLPDAMGLGLLPAELAPQEEMQLAQAWHAILAFVLMAIIIAHIYIGSVGMEGAYDAMGSGEVDEAWAQQHHSIWLEEVLTEEQTAKPNVATGTPAE